MRKLFAYLPIKDKENPNPRLVIFSGMLLFLIVVLLIINTIFLFTPSNPMLENISNFGVWGLLVFFFFFCTTESRLFISANILITLTMAVVFLTMTDTGGLFSVDKAYFLILICAAFLFSGKISGVIYSVLTIVGMSLYFWGEKNQYWSHGADSQVADASYVYMSFISAIVVTSIILFALITLIEVLEAVNRQLTLTNIQMLESKLEKKTEEVKTLKNDIARDFHDVMGNKLASISSLSQMLFLKNTSNEAEWKEEIKRINALSKEVYDGTKDFIWALDVKQNNLQQVYFYLKDFAERLYQSSDIDFISYPIEDDLDNFDLSSFACSQYILIMKEAMTNVLVHSMAKSVTFKLENDGLYFRIKLEDNGIGFDQTSLSRINGLQNMKVRAERAGAMLQLESAKGMGTRVEICQHKKELHV